MNVNSSESLAFERLAFFAKGLPFFDFRVIRLCLRRKT